MKLLYSQSTQQTYPYPRNDDQPIVGLDPDYLVLEQVETTPPTYDPETEVITPNWVVDIDALEYRQEWVVSEKPVPEPVPNYPAFNGYMLSDPMFKGYRYTVRAIDGDLNAALFNAYALVAPSGVEAFTQVWDVWTMLAGITEEDREAIAGVAEGFNLPGDFVTVIRGS